MKLTADEIKLIVFVLLAVLVGAVAKHYRHNHPMELPPRPAQTTPAPVAPTGAE